jgi:hypothetical protein
MSTQLILYPQNTNGYSYNNVPVFTEYISNYQFSSPLTAYQDVNGSASSTSYTYAVTVAASALFNSGNWVGFATTSAGHNNQTNQPLLGNGQITFYSSATPSPTRISICGVGQMLTNLTIGQLYRITIDHTGYTPAGSFVIGGTGSGTNNYVGNYGGTSPFVLTPSASGISIQDFTATATNMQLIIAYLDNINANFVVKSISISESPTSVPLTPTDLSDGQVICDLYQEQDIPLTLSVDDFTNVAEKTQSYSKDFDLPNTKRNNRIFTHIFEITKSISNVYDFNPYVQTKAALKENGVLIFEGSLRLIEIVEKDNEISYNVNLYSETVALADVLKTKTFRDLTNVFTELDHQYNYTNVEASFTGGLVLDFALGSGSFAGSSGDTTTDVLKYPFVDWTGNIDCTGSKPVIDHISNVYRPFIKLQYIIRNIISEAGYDYTSAFIDSSFFGSLFMDFNWGNGNAPTNVTNATASGAGSFPENPASPVSNFATTSYSNIELYSLPLVGNLPALYDTATHQYISNVNSNFVTLNYSIYFENTDTSSSRLLEAQILAAGSQVAYSGVISIPAFSGVPNPPQFLWQGQIQVNLNNTELIEIQFKSDVSNKIRQGEIFSFNQGTYVQYFSSIVSTNLTSGILLNTLRGDLGQWDFFKSVMTMFNLVTIADPDNPNNILIEPYEDIFGFNPTVVTPSQLDWTYKLDIKDTNLKPLELVRKTIFKYAEDDDDFAFNKYKNSSSGFLYGSQTFIQGDYTLLSGEEEIVAESFAATVIKPIQSNFPNFYAPVIYSGNREEGFEGFENMPRILIDNGVKSQDYELEGSARTTYLLMSHTDTVTSNSNDTDINFGICQLLIGFSPTDNLFSTYYAPYYEHLYNPNTRIMTAKVNLTPADINTFKFYDIVTIKNRQFRVNKIDYKPNALSTVEFILLN